MFCPNCGNPVSDNQKFCNKCGTRLPQRMAAVPQNQTNAQPAPQTPVQAAAPEPDPFGTLAQEKTRTVSQPVRPVSQPVSRPISQSTSRPVSQPVNRPLQNDESSAFFQAQQRTERAAVQEIPVRETPVENVRPAASTQTVENVWEEYRVDETPRETYTDAAEEKRDPRTLFPKNVSVDEYQQFMYGNRQKFRESHPDKFF